MTQAAPPNSSLDNESHAPETNIESLEVWGSSRIKTAYLWG